MFDRAGQIALLEQALAADPAYLRAHLEYLDRAGVGRDTRTEYRRRAELEPGPWAACLAAYAGAPLAYRAAAVPALEGLERRSGPTSCSISLLGLLYPDYDPAGRLGPRVLERVGRAVAALPELPSLWLRYAAVLQRDERWGEARAALDSALRRSDHPLDRIHTYLAIVRLLRAQGREAEAEALTRALAVATERDGRPGVLTAASFRLRYDGARGGRDPTTMEVLEELRRAAAAHGDAVTETGATTTIAANLSDAGQPLDALPLLEAALRAADSIGWREMRAEARRLMGRANTKLGRLDRAERDLLLAVEAARASGDDHQLAEAYHHLAHVHEGQNRLDDAVRAADRFVATTRGMPGFQTSMMSLRDAGLIRWKAGQPAAANAAFAGMVDAVDYQARYHYWAGEYFERIGHLQSAAEYYRRGLAFDPDERSLNLGGLARVLDALGLEDSAAAVAREHDAAMSNQLDYPLLPPILARAGHVDEALEAARAWATTQTSRGNLQGAARAKTSLAELLLKAGRPREAVEEAFAARELAGRVSLAEEWAIAERVRGTALVRAGLADSGLRALRQASERAGLSPAGEGWLGIQLALGEALGAIGEVTGALAAYARAAAAVETSMAQLGRDLDRARYRQRQLAPFDGAVRLLLQHPDRARDLLPAWSGRRKAAALAFGTGARLSSAAAETRNPLARVQEALGEDEALVDYQMVDRRSAALVVTSRRAEVVPLPLPGDSLRSLVERIRGPFTRTYAGRLDLARAGFDTSAAAALFQAVIAPLHPLIAGARRLLMVPDGPLHYLPFDALVSGSSPAGPTYLLDEFETVLLPSLRFAADRVRRSAPYPRPRRILAVGYQAPGADPEIDAVAAAWPEGLVPRLVAERATETAIGAAAPRVDLLHLATHAIADDREPEASHLRLAPDSARDGYLHLDEIPRYTPAGGVVILSACETLAGRFYIGEGLMGLARGFLAAGARSVVATQWPVGAATAGLMGRFHRELAAGQAPGTALRAAKLSFRRDPAVAHPFYWAGYVLMEGSRPRPVTDR